jgi:hypothetical protein
MYTNTKQKEDFIFTGALRKMVSARRKDDVIVSQGHILQVPINFIK